jgi:phosphate transport system substrate-binding protein
VVQGVANDLGSIGYSGIGYRTSGVKALALAEASGGAVQDPSLENCLSGAYPMARFLYIYVNKKPNESLDKLVHEFVKFVNSKEGQEVVVKDGYYPMPAAVAAETLMALK